jgi:putative spermidine/putrescine transport system permease protein
MSTEAAARRVPSAARRLAAWLHRHPRTQLWLLLALPLTWIGLVYVGSLLVLLLNGFWAKDAFSGRVIPFSFTFDSFIQLVTVDVYRTVTFRTLGMALAVTLTDVALAFPIAYYMARIAGPRMRRLMVVAVLMPLWASYLVKIYAWRTILQGNGPLAWALAPLGLDAPGLREVGNSWVVLSYLWLPYMILPIYAGLERIPNSLLEASADLGAQAGKTFRRIVLPLVLPSIVAGSIFTFSLTMGDYITPALVSNTLFIGNVIYNNSGTGNLPLAAAFSLVPVLVMVAYLLVARRLGAFESL